MVLQVYVDIVGDFEKYQIMLIECFFGIKFIVLKKVDSLFFIVSVVSIVVKVRVGYIYSIGIYCWNISGILSDVFIYFGICLW